MMTKSLSPNNIGRAGVILYTIKDGNIFLVLGIDQKSGEYSDFGGGCKRPQGKHENIIDGAYRELAEESEALFNFNFNTKHQFLVATGKSLAIVFQPIEIQDTSYLQHAFGTLVTDKSEMSGLNWLPYDQFEKTIVTYTQPLMYINIKKFLIHIIKNFNLKLALESYWRVAKASCPFITSDWLNLAMTLSRHQRRTITAFNLNINSNINPDSVIIQTRLRKYKKPQFRCHQTFNQRICSDAEFNLPQPNQGLNKGYYHRLPAYACNYACNQITAKP